MSRRAAAEITPAPGSEPPRGVTAVRPPCATPSPGCWRSARRVASRAVARGAPRSSGATRSEQCGERAPDRSYHAEGAVARSRPRVPPREACERRPTWRSRLVDLVSMKEGGLSSMKGHQGVKGRVLRGLGGLGAGSLTAFRRGWVLQSSIRSRGADQSVVRGSGAQSSGRPSSGFSEAMTTVELARACASRRGRGRRPCAVRARRSCDRQLLFRARAAAARQATDLSVA